MELEIGRVAGMVFSLSITVLFVFLLSRKIRLEEPYKNVLKAIFLAGLIAYFLSFFPASIFLSLLLQKLAYLLIGSGIVILAWEEFKRGYEESSRG